MEGQASCYHMSWDHLINKLTVPKSLSQSALGVLIGHALMTFSSREWDFSGPMTESEEEKREGDCEAGHH